MKIVTESHQSRIRVVSESHQSRIKVASESYQSRIRVASESHQSRIRVASESYVEPERGAGKRNETDGNLVLGDKIQLQNLRKEAKKGQFKEF